MRRGGATLAVRPRGLLGLDQEPGTARSGQGCHIEGNYFRVSGFGALTEGTKAVESGVEVALGGVDAPLQAAEVAVQDKGGVQVELGDKLRLMILKTPVVGFEPGHTPKHPLIADGDVAKSALFRRGG